MGSKGSNFSFSSGCVWGVFGTCSGRVQGAFRACSGRVRGMLGTCLGHIRLRRLPRFTVLLLVLKAAVGSNAVLRGAINDINAQAF